MSSNIILYIAAFIFVAFLVIITFSKSKTWIPPARPKPYIDIRSLEDSTKINYEHREKEDEPCAEGLMKKRPHYDLNELNDYYQEPKAVVPLDYKMKDIGECPISKSQKKNLPIVDVPMCLIVKDV